MSELHKEQQQRIDDIVKKHLNYIDEFYDVIPKKRTQGEHRKARQDMGLPAQKKVKKPKYGPGKCTHPGCDIIFEKNSGAQSRCSKHVKPFKYVPVAERKK
jgi:hypothetical protein